MRSKQINFELGSPLLLSTTPFGLPDGVGEASELTTCSAVH